LDITIGSQFIVGNVIGTEENGVVDPKASDPTLERPDDLVRDLIGLRSLEPLQEFIRLIAQQICVCNEGRRLIEL
jgi:hypothetical protein